MRNWLHLAGPLLWVCLKAATLPPAAPIVTATELNSAASTAPVSKIDFVVPGEKSAAEEALANRFFNQPEEHRYSGMTDADWSGKWDLFSRALVTKAKLLGSIRAVWKRASAL